MKLTAEQIQQIDYTLRKHYTFEKFDDVRMELLDHIASDVEVEMNTDQLSFENALPKVLFKWKTEISWDRNSRYDSVPNIISRFWKKLDWKFQFSTIPLAALFSYIGFQLQEKDISIYSYLFLFLILGIVSNGYLIYRKVTNKVNST